MFLVFLLVVIPCVSMEKEQKRSNKYRCPTCSYETVSSKLFSTHLIANQSHVQPQLFISPPTYIPCYRCPLCSITFYSCADCASHIKNHLSTESNIVLPTITNCFGKNCIRPFINNDQLTQHIENEYEEEANPLSADLPMQDVDHSALPLQEQTNLYTCLYKECAKTFTDKDSWIAHLQNEHSPDAAPTTSTFVPSFISSPGVRRAMIERYANKWEAPQRSYLHFCYLCETNFENDQEFQAHLRYCKAANS